MCASLHHLPTSQPPPRRRAPLLPVVIVAAGGVGLLIALLEVAIRLSVWAAAR